MARHRVRIRRVRARRGKYGTVEKGFLQVTCDTCGLLRLTQSLPMAQSVRASHIRGHGR